MKGYIWLDLLAASDLRGATKAVGYALAHFAGGNGVAWPSYDTLARAAGVDRRTAVKALAILVERGLVKVEQRAKHTGAADSNLYLLTTPDGGGVVALDHHLVASHHHLTRGGSGLTPPKQLTKETPGRSHGVEGLINRQAKRWALS